MPFVEDANSVILDSHLEENDNVFAHELSRNRSADQAWKLVPADEQVLFELDAAKLIGTSFGLHWDYELSPCLADANVDLIYLHLDPINGCGQVVLERVRCHPREYVDQTVVADFR